MRWALFIVAATALAPGLALAGLKPIRIPVDIGGTAGLSDGAMPASIQNNPTVEDDVSYPEYLRAIERLQRSADLTLDGASRSYFLTGPDQPDLCGPGGCNQTTPPVPPGMGGWDGAFVFYLGYTGGDWKASWALTKQYMKGH